MVGHLAETPHQLLGLVTGTDRIAEGDPAASRDLIHDEGSAVFAEQQSLVAGQGGVGDGQVGSGNDDAGAIQIRGTCHGRFGPGGSQHVRRQVGEREHDHDERSSQHAGGVAIQRERPPQLLRVVDVPVGNESDPDGGGDDAADADDPHRGEALGNEGGGTVKGALAEHQHAQHEREEDGLLEVESLQERGEDAGDEQPEGDVIGRFHPAEQRPREDQQPKADDAAGEVRGFENDQRHEAVEQAEALVDSWRRAGQQQQRACDERQATGDLRHDGSDVDRGELLGAGNATTLRGQLFARKQERTEDQGCEVVDGAIGEQ